MFAPIRPGCPGDTLEFTLTYVDSSGPGESEGFVVRAHANSRSPLRSHAVASGQELHVTSVVEEIQRLQMQAPPGYEDTVLGVYSGPGRCEANLVSKLRNGAEVFTAGKLEGRWQRITWPVRGWVQAESRNGSPLLVPVPPADGGLRPHLRQTVTVYPRESAHGVSTKDTPDALSELSSSVVAGPADDKGLQRLSEQTYYKERAAQVAAYDRQCAQVARTTFVGRQRCELRGIF